MEIKELQLNNYRNYKNEKILFKSGLNVICGENAQGKTNLLESIYFCSISKSLRINKDKELIMFNEDAAKIKLFINKNEGNQKIEIILSKKLKKTIKINEISVLRVGELLGTVPAVFFSPDELKLVKESPDNRRRFLDISISQISKRYFYSLLRYEKILQHRNKLLKSAKSLDEIKDSLSIFTASAINEAAKIIMHRNNFINKLKEPLKNAHEFLSGGKEKIEIEYSGILEEDEEKLKEKLVIEFEKSLKKDFEQRHTSVGPHRDDFKILVNGLDVRYYGSQGQQRTATLSLKLAETKLLKENFKEEPVLLLDDVLSELDENRKQKLLSFCKETQVILTCTEFNEKLPHNLIRIKNGKVI